MQAVTGALSRVLGTLAASVDRESARRGFRPWPAAALQSLLADVLSRVLGSVVAGLDRESVRLALWSGRLTLSRLAVKPEALSVLLDAAGVDVPVTVTAGVVRILTVTVPWGRLSSAPFRLVLDGVTVSAAPLTAPPTAARAARLRTARLTNDDSVRAAAWAAAAAAAASDGASGGGAGAAGGGGGGGGGGEPPPAPRAPRGPPASSPARLPTCKSTSATLSSSTWTWPTAGGCPTR
ncbi:hypothetical protein BU14_0275s0027 [Porphyra umbilicalis]|uniref:Autophagy-related protein 2 n=1 Tax=Porphyra umbilicalis TaxID=2786 RepID=A0A1X6P1C3_PORUM|nr:hypothetical protein BU14_0275s0027 [Porphyra umbilicalis]|eukprot:OSX74668.1 hypothetical protein BU14_0275s0027 [Porphyra umbilicalis]